MRRWQATGGKVLISALLLWLIFKRIDLVQLRTTFERVRLSLFLLSLGLYIGGQLLSSYRWKVLLKPLGLSVSYSRLVALYFLGMFFNFFFPTVIGGDAVKLYYLARETNEITKSTASVFMERNTGLFGLLLVATVVSTIGNVTFGDTELIFPLLGLVVLYLAANVVLFYDPTYTLLARVFFRLRLKRLIEVTAKFRDSFLAYRRSHRRVAAAIGLSLIFDLALIGLNYANAFAVGAAIAFKYFCVFVPIIALISMLPITLYGLGLREYSFIFFFSQLGVSRETCLLIALLWFFVTLFSSVPGVFIYITYRRMPTPLHPQDSKAGEQARLQG